jgi:hypothetical protein
MRQTERCAGKLMMASKIIPGRPLCFSTFHADVGADGSEQGPHPKANLANLRYVRNIELLFRSVNVFHPHSRLSLMTSARTDLTALKVRYLRLDSRIDAKALMLSRSLAQQHMVNNDDFSLPIVLIDSDILLNGSLESVFEQDFDVALTWRKSVNMPINGGLLILNNRRPDVVRKFFDDFVAIYREKYIDGAGWYGDQLSLRDVCGVTYGEMRDRKLIEINGCKILFLPCDRFNFSPEDSFAAVMAPISNIAVLHFKGYRKRFMEAYWLAHLQLRERSSMLRRLNAYLVRKSLARKAKREVISVGNNEDE